MFQRFPFLVCGLLAALALGACTATGTTSGPLIRYKLPNSTFPIANAVEIPPGASTIYLSGKVPPVVDSTKPATDREAYGGDTEGQTVAVLKSVEVQLKSMNLAMSDVVKMQVFLVKDPAKGGKMDFAGFMKGYTRFFGTADQPNLPARSAFEIAALANPAYLVEIEVIAVRGAKSVTQ
ncbi:RidA family protein [Variovorax sp. J31P207]|uniref:RidA family protein n=1 Tax=Variovorax sp. J31P207 TaxID=3053510 RepID=UPI002578F05A|nr:RidA family protein [Variovorax sp. J31P207]MDM0071564.1 RidA family protein [Variovorax sp. J31P207]